MVLGRVQSGRTSGARRLFCFRLQLLCPPPILSHHITSCTQHTPHANHIHRLHPHATRTTRRAPHTHCTYHTLTIPGITPPTPRTFTHTTSTPHQGHSSHTIISTHLTTTETRSCSRKLEMAYSCPVPVDALCARSSLSKLSKAESSLPS
jgi:hypothetical protein